MKNCPTCGRRLPEEARVCRGCYTVISKDDEQDIVQRQKTGRVLFFCMKSAVFFVVLFSALFFFQFELPFKSNGPGNPGSRDQRSLFQIFGGRDTQTATRHNVHTAASHKVEPQEDYCTIRQRVRNVSQVPLPRLALNVQFRNASRVPVGELATSVIKELLAPDSELLLTLELPCPSEADTADVSVPASTQPGEQALVLTSTERAGKKWERAEQGTLGPEYNLVVVEASELSLCEPPEPCELEVVFDHGSRSSYEFNRNIKDPSELIARNPLLVAHLRAGKSADLIVPSHSGEQEIQLTSENLRQTKSQGSLARWIADLFQT